MAAIDIEEGSETPPSYPDGVAVKTAAGNTDETAKTGHCTTITRLAPDAVREKISTHDSVGG